MGRCCGMIGYEAELNYPPTSEHCMCTWMCATTSSRRRVHRLTLRHWVEGASIIIIPLLIILAAYLWVLPYDGADAYAESEPHLSTIDGSVHAALHLTHTHEHTHNTKHTHDGSTHNHNAPHTHEHSHTEDDYPLTGHEGHGHAHPHWFSSPWGLLLVIGCTFGIPLTIFFVREVVGCGR